MTIKMCTILPLVCIWKNNIIDMWIIIIVIFFYIVNIIRNYDWFIANFSYISTLQCNNVSLKLVFLYGIFKWYCRIQYKNGYKSQQCNRNWLIKKKPYNKIAIESCNALTKNKKKPTTNLFSNCNFYQSFITLLHH